MDEKMKLVSVGKNADTGSSILDFIRAFSEKSGCNDDELVELVFSAETIPGICAVVMNSTLSIMCELQGGSYCELMKFRYSAYRTEILVSTDRLTYAMEAADFFPFEADDYLNFAKLHEDKRRQKYADNESGHFYLDVYNTLADTDGFISAFDSFAKEFAEDNC